MRSVDKGEPPKSPDGSAVTFLDFHEAAPHLKSRIGRLCSYCERVVGVSLAVEHKRPKSRFPDLACEWSNLLLACAICNGCKGDKEVENTIAVFPDEDDTSNMVAYLRDGSVVPRIALSAGDTERVHATLSMLGLSRLPKDVTSSDHRWFDRLEVWRTAEQTAVDLAAKDSHEMRRTIAEVARAKGGYSIWRTVFSNDRDMCDRLSRVFPGTRHSLPSGEQSPQTPPT